MAAREKVISLFLLDGAPNGRVKCTVANWTGVVYRIPRTELDKCGDREDLSRSGVYFLFGKSDETGEDLVYVGQAGTRKNGEGVLNRLMEHRRNPEKDYWVEAVIFTTSNNSFGPTEISYLESRFCGIAKEAKRYAVKNGVDPTSGNITEEKKCELDEFIEFAKIAMGTLGYSVFEPLVIPEGREKTELDADDELHLYMERKDRKTGKVIRADCKRTREGFVVLKGSQIDTTDLGALPKSVRERRQEAKISEDGVLLEDILSRSPSNAASFVIGGSANGWVEWKTAGGMMLKDFEEKNA